ncbi:membrane protein, putative [Acidisarcina polymorpha]|uniref:Membrane protein, putative n=1 Tax=Acidisarcina polymorpha TaxID=2211140 RepID=A0A2Z5G9L5_9BACT|nr:DUF418 domain-containing protein [Acidisarcina polymorpha]AXC15709.1 membrane protein, putative [Acidisarcina polymorpha]
MKPPTLAPKDASERIAVLDIQRGIAILLIFLVNITNMGNSVYEHFGDARLLGWQPKDRICWWVIRLFVDGTQRGLLQFLFGAGALILLSRTQRPEGPVAVADLYFRRNFLLIFFGLFDIFGLLWFGDILYQYGAAALFLFPLRRLKSKTLLAISLAAVVVVTAQSANRYRHQVASYTASQDAQKKQSLHQPLTTQDAQAIAQRAAKLASLRTPTSALAEERSVRMGPFWNYANWCTHIWLAFVYPTLVGNVAEVLFPAILGMALYKFGVTQGERSTLFYACSAVFCYIPGLALRASDALVFIKFEGLPSKASIFSELARLLITLGHVALMNLLVRTRPGLRLLTPFKAAGRTAFSLYLIQNFLGMWILFPGFAFGLFGRFGWFGLTSIALAIMIAQLLLATLWLHFFTMGPLEWVWRSLAYNRQQPFRKHVAQFEAV